MITNNDLHGTFDSEFSGDRFFIRFIRNILKNVRVSMARKYIYAGQVHIDIGCGDAALLKKSPCKEKIGLDRLYGDHIDRELKFKDKYADCITMLAFIEHLDNPNEIIKECSRVLKDNGKLIMTTPLKGSEKYLKLWHKNINEEHKMYFNYDAMKKLLQPYFKIVIFKKVWLNQLFVCKKA